MKRQQYIVYVTRDDQGYLQKVPIPMRYAYVFVAAAVVGLFTITGLAGSYIVLMTCPLGRPTSCSVLRVGRVPGRNLKAC